MLGPTVLFALCVAAGAGLSYAVAWGRPILGARWGLLWLLAAWAATSIVGALASRGVALPMVVAAAVVIRLAALGGPPTTSDDLYRYAWDGRVQAAGIDPYRYPPAAPQLASLRDGWLWPDAAGCRELDRPPGCTRINRPPARTIYPPVGEAWFALIERLGGLGSRHKSWQISGLIVDLFTVGLLIVALRRWGRDERWVALYALLPAPALELVNNAHVDGLALALMLAALVVARPPPDPRLTPIARDIVVGLLIGGAALIKVYPAIVVVVLAPTLLRVVRVAAVAAALAVAVYVPHVVAVGAKVAGYLPGYLKEEHYTKGGRFLLAAGLGMHGTVATVAAVVALTGVVVAVVGRRPDPPTGAVVLLGTLLLVTSPVQPWYAVAVVAVAVLAARPWWVAVVVAGYPYFWAIILASGHALEIGEVSYGMAAAVVIGIEVGLRRRQRQAHGEPAAAALVAD